MKKGPPFAIFRNFKPIFSLLPEVLHEMYQTKKVCTDVFNKNGLFPQVDLWLGSGLKVQKTSFCCTLRPFMATWSNLIRKLTSPLDSPSNSTIESVLVIQHLDYTNSVRRLILVKNWLKNTKFSLLSTVSCPILGLAVFWLKNWLHHRLPHEILL